MTNGVTTNNVSNRVSSSDEILVNKDGSTGLQTTADLAIQFSASGPISERLNDAQDRAAGAYATAQAINAEVLELSNQVSAAAQGYRGAATWTGLAAIMGAAVGQLGRVAATDTGTHTDPVVGGIVANSGEFVWSASPAGWMRTGDLNLAKSTDADALNRANNVSAITPKTLERKLAGSIGDLMTDEDFVYAIVDRNGDIVWGLDHDGRVIGRYFENASDEEFEASIVDDDGNIIIAKRWGENTFRLGPFYSDAPSEATIIDGKAYALGDRAIPVPSLDGDAVWARMDGPDIVFKTVSGGLVTTRREDMRAVTSLAAGVTKLRQHAFFGQSLATGSNSGAALTTSPPVAGRVLMPNAGIRALGNDQSSTHRDELLPQENMLSLVDAFERTDGTTGETPASAMAARLAASYPTTDAILISTHGIGGSTYAQIKKGTVPYANLIAAIRRGFIISKVLGLDYEVAVHFVHGEANTADAALTYKGYLVELQADLTTDIQALTGTTDQVMLYVSQLASFTPATSSNVPAGQAAAARDNPTKIVLVGPKYHLATGDGTHLISISQAAAGDMAAGAVIRKEAAQPPVLVALSAVRSGTTITVTCDVPTAPIVRDTTLVTDPAGDAGAPAGIKYGLIYSYSGGTAGVTISNVTASGSTLVVTLSGNPGAAANQFLRIGVDNAASAGAGPTTGARTCFRDSSAGANAYSSPRYNWLCQDILPVN